MSAVELSLCGYDAEKKNKRIKKKKKTFIEKTKSLLKFE